MVLFQINEIMKSGMRVARYFKMDDYETVVRRFKEMKEDGVVFDYEVIG